MACNCNSRRNCNHGGCNHGCHQGCHCGCNHDSRVADWFFTAAPDVSKFSVTLSPAFLATHTSCCGGCLVLVGGRYRCGAFSADAVKNQKPYCPYGYGART
jgi:hypothetical protein